MGTASPTTEDAGSQQRWPTLARFASLPLSAVCIHLIDHPWPVEHWLCQAFWMLAAGGMFLCLASMFHETAHRTLTPFSWIDIWYGRILGTLMLVPYTTYRETHVRHHAYLNTPQDFELWPYSDPTKTLNFRRAFAVFDLLLAGPAAAIIYGRTYFHSSSPIRTASIRRTIALEYVGMAAFWTVVLSVVVTSNSLSDFVMLWLIPQAISSTLQAGRKMTEHLGMSSYDPLLGTRTVIGTSWFTKIYSYLNFEIFVHGPHHRHPRAQHSDLKDSMDSYVQENPDVSYPVYSSYWSAFMAMLPSLWNNPGVGMNCRTDAPAVADEESRDNPPLRRAA